MKTPKREVIQMLSCPIYIETITGVSNSQEPHTDILTVNHQTTNQIGRKAFYTSLNGFQRKGWFSIIVCASLKLCSHGDFKG